MKKILSLLLFGLVIVSCSKTDDHPENPDVNDPLVTKMNGIFYSNTSPYNQPGITLNFEYNTAKKLTKKVGGLLPIPNTSGFTEIFSDKIYTTLTYSNNNVTVEHFSSSTDFTVAKNTKLFAINPLDQILIKEVLNSGNYGLTRQTFTYVNNKLSEIKTTRPDRTYNSSDPNDYLLTYLEKFYFDANGNLSKAEYFEQRNGINKGLKIIRTFEDYDSATNPCKRLFLLDDYFYRSLSKNNFRKYTEAQYYNDVLASTNSFKWTFSYNTNGQIIVN